MNAVQSALQKSGETLHLTIGNVNISPSYIQAAVIIFLIFILLLVLANWSRGYLSWYMSGWYIWSLFGFLLALIIEGLFIANGTTILTQALGWKNAPKPVKFALQSGREKLIDILVKEGLVYRVGDEKTITLQSVLEDFTSLQESDKESAAASICKP